MPVNRLILAIETMKTFWILQMKKNKKNYKETKKKCDFSAKFRRFIKMKKRIPHDCINAKGKCDYAKDRCMPS